MLGLGWLGWIYLALIVVYIGIIVYDFYTYDYPILFEKYEVRATYRDGSTKTFTDMKKLKNPEDIIKIDCSNGKMRFLEGIEKCTSLEELNCSYNMIASLVSIGGNKILPASLKKLDCSHNYLQSLYGVEQCINLEEIRCNNNWISFLSGLRDCRALKVLYCGLNRITTLYGLENCTILKELHCDNNLITFLPTFMLDLKDLVDINIEGNPIETLTVLTGQDVNEFVNKINGKRLTRLKVYNDGQNTHNSAITRAIRDSIKNLMDEEPIDLNTLVF
jgi:Leucine-rich repeat (LRR) protein